MARATTRFLPFTPRLVWVRTTLHGRDASCFHLIIFYFPPVQERGGLGQDEQGGGAQRG